MDEPEETVRTEVVALVPVESVMTKTISSPAGTETSHEPVVAFVAVGLSSSIRSDATYSEEREGASAGQLCARPPSNLLSHSHLLDDPVTVR